MEPNPRSLEVAHAPRRSWGERALIVVMLIVAVVTIVGVAWLGVSAARQQPAVPATPAKGPPVPPPPGAPVALPQDPWQVSLTVGQTVSLPGASGTPTLTLDRLDDRTAYISLSTTLGSMPISGQSELSVPNGPQRIYFRLIYVRTGEATFNVSFASRYPVRLPATASASQPAPPAQ